MEKEIIIRTGNARTPLSELRDWLAVGVRHRRLMSLSFLGVFAGAVLSVFLLPVRYQANTKILVKHERADLVVSSDPTGGQQQLPSAVTEMELNSEVELIKSPDLLEKVATACGLQKAASHPGRLAWLHFSRGGGNDANRALAAAVRGLNSALKVETLAKTNLISISYNDSDPSRAAQVLNTLVNLYMEKHLAVHRSTGTLEFFREQTKQYEEGLKTAEARLAEFSKDQDVVSPDQQKTATLQKLSEFQADLKQAHASIAESEERIHSLEAQAAALPTRTTTQLRTADNLQLMQQYRSTLLNLELKRTELLQKFEPTYRLVREVDTQIAQTQAAIEAAEKSKPTEETTDRNPVFEWVNGELAKARSQLAADQARAEALSRSVRSYQEQASELEQKGALQEGLLRDKNTEEANYLLYQRKQEEARISDELDRSRIINVAVAEAATVPTMKTRSNMMILLGGLLAGFLVSLSVAVASEFLNPSLVTSGDVIEFLDLPVLAEFSIRGPKGD